MQEQNPPARVVANVKIPLDIDLRRHIPPCTARDVLKVFQSADHNHGPMIGHTGRIDFPVQGLPEIGSSLRPLLLRFPEFVEVQFKQRSLAASQLGAQPVQSVCLGLQAGGFDDGKAKTRAEGPIEETHEPPQVLAGNELRGAGNRQRDKRTAWNRCGRGSRSLTHERPFRERPRRAPFVDGATAATGDVPGAAAAPVRRRSATSGWMSYQMSPLY